MSVKANFNVPAKVDIDLPILQEDGSFQSAELEMRAKLIKGKESETYFSDTGEDSRSVQDILREHIVTPPAILDEDDEPYSLEVLMDIPYIRNAMYARLLAASFDPVAARGNSQPQ